MINDPNPSPCRLSGRIAWLLLALLLTLTSCGGFEDKRINELKHEKGFGSRADGDATRENYLGGFDTVSFIVPPAVLPTVPPRVP